MTGLGYVPGKYTVHSATPSGRNSGGICHPSGDLGDRPCVGRLGNQILLVMVVNDVSAIHALVDVGFGDTYPELIIPTGTVWPTCTAASPYLTSVASSESAWSMK